MENQNLVVAMPGVDELYQEFVNAIRDGVHENIRWVVKSISWYIEKAKDEIPNIIGLDPQTWLFLNIDIASWDHILSSFVEKQGFIARNALKVLLSTVWASTFSNFIEKMKKNEEDKEVTINTLSNIMRIFFENLGKKYLTQENGDTIRQKIANLFI